MSSENYNHKVLMEQKKDGFLPMRQPDDCSSAKGLYS